MPVSRWFCGASGWRLSTALRMQTPPARTPTDSGTEGCALVRLPPPPRHCRPAPWQLQHLEATSALHVCVLVPRPDSALGRHTGSCGRHTQPVQQNRWVRVELVVPFGALACALGTSALLDLFGVLLPKSAMAQPSWTGYSITLQLVLRHACCDMRREQSNSTNLLVVGPTPPWETGSASKGLTQSPKVASPTPRLGCCASRFNQIAAVTQDAGECARPDIVGAPECSGGSRGCWCSLVLLAAALVECFNQCAPQLDPRIHRWMVLPRRSTVLPGQEHNTTVRERQTRQPNATAL